MDHRHHRRKVHLAGGLFAGCGHCAERDFEQFFELERQRHHIANPLTNQGPDQWNRSVGDGCDHWHTGVLTAELDQPLHRLRDIAVHFDDQQLRGGSQLLGHRLIAATGEGHHIGEATGGRRPGNRGNALRRRNNQHARAGLHGAALINEFFEIFSTHHHLPSWSLFRCHPP